MMPVGPLMSEHRLIERMVNMIEVPDPFLQERERRRQLNLQLSGRPLFYAATLLRMKSEYLDTSIEETPEDFLEDESDLFDFIGFPEGPGGPIDPLEREIQRRLDRKNLRKRPVTLFELILELKNAEKEQRRKQRFREPFSMDLMDVEEVVGIAHEEGYREAAAAVLCQCEDTIATEGVMTLHDLAKLLGKGLSAGAANRAFCVR